MFRPPHRPGGRSDPGLRPRPPGRFLGRRQPALPVAHAGLSLAGRQRGALRLRQLRLRALALGVDGGGALVTSLLQRKTISLEAFRPDQRLKPTLSWFHLIPLGVGAIVGTGIYTLIGVGANLAGPAVLLSFLIAGAICACAALAYAEVATMIPVSGSAYTYSYVVLGEIIAWVVGWSLILEYSLVVSAVAVGWSGYAVGFLNAVGIHLPQTLSVGLYAGGLVNLPAIAVIAVVAGLLMLGTRESATINAVLVAVKIIALGLFVVVAGPRFHAANFHPFMPYGFVGHDIAGTSHG